MPLLLLDLDGTLADWDAAFWSWADATLGASYDRAWVAEINAGGMTPRRELLAAVRERCGLADDVDALLEDYDAMVWAALPRLGDEVVARLEALRAGGWKVAVVSNGDEAPQRATVERIGAAPLVDAVIASGAVGVRKPDPRIVEAAAAACGEGLDGAWLIGDGEADVGAAAAAGITSVWLAQDRTWTRDDVRPDHVAESLIDALERVRG